MYANYMLVEFIDRKTKFLPLIFSSEHLARLKNIIYIA